MPGERPSLAERVGWTDSEEIAYHVRQILSLAGHDPADQHFANTPERFTKVLEAYSQRDLNLNDLLKDGFEDDDPQETEKTLVTQTNINFLGLCAHHLLPFFGTAAVGYLPTKRVVGLSKLTRLVYAAGHISPTTQEHITNLVADALFNPAGPIRPKGVAVLTSALHSCMSSRGVEAPSTWTTVTAVRGVFLEVPALETKFMDVVKLNSRG